MNALLALALAAAVAQDLPCQMDPKFKGASCDDPAYQAATRRYQACAASQQGGTVAAGYTCIPSAPAAQTSMSGCPCTFDPNARHLSCDDPAWAVATQKWEDCSREAVRQGAHCTARGYGCIPVAAKPAQKAATAPVSAAPLQTPTKPGYGQFGRALVNSAQSSGGPAPAPAPAPPPAARRAVSNDSPAPAQQQNAPAPNGGVNVLLPSQGADSQPLFAPMAPANSDDSQRQWLQHQRELMRRSKPAPQPKPRPDDDSE